MHEFNIAKTISFPYNYMPRDYQVPLHMYMDSTDAPRRAFRLAHRRAGKDIDIWNILIKETQKRVGSYWYMFPELKQGRRALWEEKVSDDGKTFFSFIPEELIASKRDSDMLIRLTNGSSIQILGADRYDSNVGANPIGVVFSEYALTDPRAWQFVRPILAQNGGWAIFNTTPRGKNHAYDLFKVAANSKNWFCQLLTVDDTRKMCPKLNKPIPVISTDFIAQERAEGMPEELIQQEYYCSFEAGQVGSYYSQAMQRAANEDRIHSISTYNKEHPVYTAWDIGISDATSIWYFQMYDNDIHFIEYNEFEGVPVIVSSNLVLGNFGATPVQDILSPEVIEEYKVKYAHHATYNYAEHFAPVDIKKRDQGTGLPTYVVAKKQGLQFKILPQATSVIEGINNVRKILPYAHFDHGKADIGISALRDYQKKYDSKNKVFLDTPLHNWASHPADAMRYACMAITMFINKSFIKEASQSRAHEYNRLDIVNTQERLWAEAMINAEHEHYSKPHFLNNDYNRLEII